MKPIKCLIRYDYGDGITICIKYFKSINKAKHYCKQSKISPKKIERISLKSLQD